MSQKDDKKGSSELPHKIETIADRVRQMGESARSKGPKQLPLFGEKYAVAPNEFGRAALFKVRNNKEPRQRYDDSVVFTAGNHRILFSGEELRDDDDQLVWYSILRLAQASGQDLREPFEVTGWQLLHDLKWGNDGKSYRRLRACIKRLRRASLTVHSPKFDGVSESKSLDFNMIRKYEFGDGISHEAENEPAFDTFDEGGKLLEPNYEELDRNQIKDAIRRSKWKIWLEEEVYLLFRADQFALLNWDNFLELGSVARQMYLYYSTHRSPFPHPVSLIYRLVDSNDTNTSRFRNKVIRALDELKQIDFLADHSIERKPDGQYEISVRRKLKDQTPKK
ncbi:plasmid replication initiator TrfA [Chitinibacter tainanensis]|uniref:plasmid replication initiator TrfA n=1 Tax=Chitinibacter tainanensis TaxID=230667 RepID=UPI0003F915E9|nr:plasmid replication initiator TrfA [Chitinibacter tainanensis]